MSSDYVIKVENLSKCYQIYDKPRDRLKQFVLPHLQRSMGRQPHQYFREFWALKDISFEVKKGETVGIVGCNGSGKSTLLQLICGTLSPTSGDIQTVGRIAALLELGSGFNLEFTGYENVYLNASVLGLKKEEIDARYEDILSFSGIGDFINQPVKTYSSGMMLRLAFAVIAHVDADILVVDEALAVGDAVFTQKCMRFIRAFQEQGTLLFVSHDMGSIVNLCSTAVWLDRGSARMQGAAKWISQAYLQHTLQDVYGDQVLLQEIAVDKEHEIGLPAMQAETVVMTTGLDLPECSANDCGAQLEIISNLAEAQGFHTGSAKINSILIENLDCPETRVFQGGERVRVKIRARANVAIDQPILGFAFKDRLGQVLFGDNTLSFTNSSPVSIAAGQSAEASFFFRLPMLPNGEYTVFASFAQGTLYDNIQHHLLHDALIVKVSSSKVRWGLVGIPFERVELKVYE